MQMSKKPRVANPSDPVLWCKEATSRMESGDTRGAIFCYGESVRIRPGVPDVWFNLGCLFEKNGETKEALTTHTTAAKMFPADFRFPAEHARLLAESGKYSDAVNAISEALTISPYSPALLANKAGYLIFAGDTDGALHTSEESLSIDPSCVPAYLHKAHAQTLLKKVNEAKETLTAGLTAVPDDSRLLKMQANLYLRCNEYEAGLASIEKVLLLTPDDAESWSIKGVACANLERKEDAVVSFERAMKLDPRQKSYRQNRDAVKKS